MGASQPNQEASGSGYTVQKTDLPQDVVNATTAGFKGALADSLGSTSALGTNQAPGVQNIGNFNPSQMNLQNSVGLQSRGNEYDLGNLWSKDLDPLVSGQLSQTYQEGMQGGEARNQRMADQMGEGNQALLATMQAENNMNTAMQSGPARLAAMQQQRQYDVESRGAAERAAGLDQQRMSQFNQAAINQGNFANAAQQQAFDASAQQFGINADAMSANNAANLGMYNAQNQNQLGAAQAQNDLMKTLGEGMISTGTQMQGNFTIDDLQKMKDNPELMNPSLWGGNIVNNNVSNLGENKYNLNGPSGGPKYVAGKGWHNPTTGQYQDAKPQVGMGGFV